MLSWAPWSPAARLAKAKRLSDAGRAPEALAIWRRLAAAGHPRAMANLGAALAIGAGTPPDPAVAHLWLERAAHADDAPAQRNLAILLLPQGREHALPWFRRAAAAHDPTAQHQLSLLLDDPAEARHWAHQAAAQGHVDAAATLATMCHEASGGPRDPVAAAHWWRIAALSGHADSAAMLGAAHHLGQGVAQDDIEAMAWLLVAAARHSSAVRPFYAPAEARLTPPQLAQARARAQTLAEADGNRTHRPLSAGRRF